MNGQELLVVLIALLIVYAMFLIVSIVLIERQPNDWKGGTLLGLTTAIAAVGAGGSFIYWKSGDKLEIEYKPVEYHANWSEMGFDKLDYANKDIWDKLAEKIDTFILYYPELETKKLIPNYNDEMGYYVDGNENKIQSAKEFYRDCNNDYVKKIIVLYGIYLTLNGMGGNHKDRSENIYPGIKHFLPEGILYNSISNWKLDKISTQEDFYKYVDSNSKSISNIFIILNNIHTTKYNKFMKSDLQDFISGIINDNKELFKEYKIYDILDKHYKDVEKLPEYKWTLTPPKLRQQDDGS
jgi:hypothetical protein